MKPLFSLFAATALLTACSADDVVSGDSVDGLSVVGEKDSVVSISDEGYLVFPTAVSLQDYMENLSSGQDYQGGSSKTSKRISGKKRFVSVAELAGRISENEGLSIAKRVRRASENSDDDDISDLEEMTEDEYNLMKAENLLFDDVLTHMVDTTLRICVEGRLYKITEQGTFSVDVEKSELLESSIQDFDAELVEALEPGETVDLGNDVAFTNTFAEASVSSSELECMDEAQGESTTAAAPADTYTENQFHLDYNAQSHKWKSHSLYQKFLELLRGKDVSRENKFDKNHRVQMKVFDVNYSFYASAGVKVTMQKRKKFLGIPYWKATKADKIVIGFNGLDGVMKYNNPRTYSSIDPTVNKQWGDFTGALNGIPSKFYYGIYHDLPFIKDWTKDIVCVMPAIFPGDDKWRNEICNKLYEAPAKLVYGQLKSLANKQIFSPVKRQITPKEPMLAYYVWGNSSVNFNKEHPYITGIKEYTDLKSKSVIFDRSFGFTVLNASVSGFLPSEFDIEKIDAFGAVYYDNKWKGVRFYKY